MIDFVKAVLPQNAPVEDTIFDELLARFDERDTDERNDE